MKYCRNLFLYLLAVILLGALFAPMLFELANTFGMFSDTPFKRVANRAFMLVGLALFYPLMKSLKVDRLEYLGVGASRQYMGSAVFRGLLYGIMSMSILIALECQFGFFLLNSNFTGDQFQAWFWIKRIVKSLGTGLVVAFIEELFFRGAVLHVLRRELSLHKAIFVSSLFFSFIHFIRSADVVPRSEVNWCSGFKVLGSAFHSFVDPLVIGPFLALFVVGVFLAYLRVETGSIFASIGVHAGWVFCIQIGRKLFVVDFDSDYYIWIRGYDKMTGYSSFVWVSILLLAMLTFFKFRKRKIA